MNLLKLFIGLFLTIATSVTAQTIDRTYSGSFVSSYFECSFKKDGTFSWTAEGHIGSRKLFGNYRINNDTIVLYIRGNDSAAPYCSKYMMQGDSIIINLDSYTGYKIERPGHAIGVYYCYQHFDVLGSVNLDSSILVSPRQFDSLVREAITVLNQQDISQIHDSTHVVIIRLINTIHYSSDTMKKRGIYADFINLIFDKDYERRLLKLYTWTPNRGMGMYCLKLQIELGGSPRPFSKYTIIRVSKDD